MRRVLLPSLLATLLAPVSALGHEAGVDLGDRVSARVERALGGNVSIIGDGLYAVRAGGERFTTHGPDFPADRRDPLADGPGSLDVGDPERAPVCAANPETDYHQDVLYAHPSSAANRLAGEAEAIRGIMRRINALLDQESHASGGGHADYVVRCEVGAIRVSAIAVPSADTQASFTEIVGAAKAAGFGRTRVDYTVFYDGPGPGDACGVGHLSDDDRLIAENRNNNPAGGSPDYAVSFRGCWYGDTPMHEIGHNQGAVQAGAPFSTGDGGHCYQADDVMCYSPDGGNAGQEGTVPCATQPGTLHYDCGWDTYFDSAPEPGEWLANHWNLGSPLNRFVRFSAGGHEPPPPPPPPPPDDEPVDAAAPDTTIQTTRSRTSRTRFTIRFGASEAATFECSVDGRRVTECGSPLTLRRLGRGGHVFTAAATDAAGNTDPTPARKRFRVTRR